MKVVHGPGPWTRSTVHRVVHGPGPQGWSMDLGPCFVYVLAFDVCGSSAMTTSVYGMVNRQWQIEFVYK